MTCPQLPKAIWSHIRSFSGDKREPTPAASLMHGVSFLCETEPSRFSFPWGHDGYASTLPHAHEGRFRRRASKCRNSLCTVCQHRGWSCKNAVPNAVEEDHLMRLKHYDSDGYLIRSGPSFTPLRVASTRPSGRRG